MAAFNLPIPVTDAVTVSDSVSVSDKERIAALEKKVALLSEAVVSLLVLKAEAEHTTELKLLSWLNSRAGGGTGTIEERIIAGESCAIRAWAAPMVGGAGLPERASSREELYSAMVAFGKQMLKTEELLRDISTA